jgi:uncharacterized protein
MIPFYFGAGRRRLFGIYDPACRPAVGSRAAVLCHPWGSEYLHAHRNMRQLAIRLALTGFHALRFDYFGTGDSSGEMTEADLQGWVSDIEVAIDELRDMTGATRVALIGLRLGATLAATVAVKRPKDVNALVLWDPVVFGEEYLQELHLGSASVSQATARPLAAPSDFDVAREIGGFILTHSMAREFQAINLLTLIPPLSARTLIISTDALSSYDALLTLLSKLNHGSLAIEQMQDILPWVEDLTKQGAIAVNVLRRIIQWLE